MLANITREVRHSGTVGGGGELGIVKENQN